MSGLLTPLIGLIAVYIAYQQYRTNHLRERREARAARLSVYKRVKRFLNAVDSTCEVSGEAYDELTEAIAEADFLFPDEITDWLSDLQGSADEFRNQRAAMDAHLQEYGWPKGNYEPLREHSPECYAQAEKEIQRAIDELQNAHCELKNRFEKHI